MSFKKKYINTTNAAGISVTEASPLDDRHFVEGIQSLALALTGNPSMLDEPFIGVMYEKMSITDTISDREYIWMESTGGLIEGGYTYPEYFNDISGVDYGGRKFNIVLKDNTSKIDITFTNSSSDGLVISDEDIPKHILKDKLSAQILMKSSASNYQEIEIPESIIATATGLKVILNPKPAIGEKFKITLF